MPDRPRHTPGHVADDAEAGRYGLASIPPALSLPRGEVVLLTEDVLTDVHDALYRDARSGYRWSEELTFVARMIGRAVQRIEARTASPSVLPAGLANSFGDSRDDLQTVPASPKKVIDLDQAAVILKVTSRERARQLVREHELDCWPNPDGRHELLMRRAEVIALAEQRRSRGGTGVSEQAEGTDPG